jgi:hypothetical protein
MAAEAALKEFFRDRDKVAAYVREHINPAAGDEDVKT